MNIYRKLADLGPDFFSVTLVNDEPKVEDLVLYRELTMAQQDGAARLAAAQDVINDHVRMRAAQAARISSLEAQIAAERIGASESGAELEAAQSQLEDARQRLREIRALCAPVVGGDVADLRETMRGAIDAMQRKL